MDTASHKPRSCQLFLAHQKLVVLQDDFLNGELRVVNDEEAEVLSLSFAQNGEDDVRVGEAILRAFARVEIITSLPERRSDYLPPYVIASGFNGVEAFAASCPTCGCIERGDQVIVFPTKYNRRQKGFRDDRTNQVFSEPDPATLGRNALTLLVHTEILASLPKPTEPEYPVEIELEVSEYTISSKTWEYRQVKADAEKVFSALRSLDQSRYPHFTLRAKREHSDTKSLWVMGGNGSYYILAIVDPLDDEPNQLRAVANIHDNNNIHHIKNVEVWRAEYPYFVDGKYIVSKELVKRVMTHFLETCDFDPGVKWQ